MALAWDVESILPIVASIVHTTILSIMNAAIASQRDPSRKIRERWGCREEPNLDCGSYTLNVTPIFDNYTAARWVKAVMQLSNPTHFGVLYCGQQADVTAGAQTPLRAGRSNLPLDHIHPPPAEDMIDYMGEELDDDCEMRCPNPRSFLMMNTGFQKFEPKLHRRIISQQRYLEVIRNRDLGLIADYEQRLGAEENVAWLREHDHIVNPATPGSLPNMKDTNTRPAAN
jgi:hypothetical protein